jgi:hypothetical protein
MLGKDYLIDFLDEVKLESKIRKDVHGPYDASIRVYKRSVMHRILTNSHITT